MPLKYWTFSPSPPLDDTCLMVDVCSPAAEAVWRKRGKCDGLYRGSCKADPSWMGKGTQTRIHRAPQIHKGPLGPSTSTERRENPEYDTQQRISAQSKEYQCGYLEALHSLMKCQTAPRSFGLGTKDNKKEKKCIYAYSFLPPSGDWGNYSRLKYHHMLRYELTETDYCFAPQNGRSTHRKICL